MSKDSEVIDLIGRRGRSVPSGPDELLAAAARGDEAAFAQFYDLLEARHPGWENNDGAFGEFRWDVVSGALAHVHHERFTDYDTTEHEGV